MSPSLTGILTAVALLPCLGAGDPQAPAPFAAAAGAPKDVTLLVHVEDAKGLRRDLAARPFGRFLEAALARGEGAAVWRALATAAGMRDEELFDHWLGDAFTLMVRGDEPRDWALVTSIEPSVALRSLEGLNPLIRAPRHGLAVMELPEADLRLARRRETWLIGPGPSGPGARSRLFDELLPVLADDGAHPEALADEDALRTARTLGDGWRIEVFARHAQPLGGWSALVADLDDGHARLRHVARFDAPPFQRPITASRWDSSPLDAFEGEALLAIIEPTDIGAGPAEAFAQSVLGEPFISPALRANVDDCQILALGEVEGRLANRPIDQLLPTAALAIKVVDCERARRDLDTQLQRVVLAMERLGQGRYLVDLPAIGALKASDPRRVELDDAMEHFAQGFPIMRSISLNWTVTSGPHGNYCVIATHPEQLGLVVKALSGASPPAPRSGPVPPRPARAPSVAAGAGRGPEATQEGACGSSLGSWSSCGTFDGARIGVHLRSYCDQVKLLVSGEAEAAAFRDTILLFSELASGIDRCRWQMRRPDPNAMHLEVQLELQPPESASP